MWYRYRPASGGSVLLFSLFLSGRFQPRSPTGQDHLSAERWPLLDVSLHVKRQVVRTRETPEGSEENSVFTVL